MDSFVTLAIFIVLVALIGIPYWRRLKKTRQATEQQRVKSAKAGLVAPATLHPHINLLTCIGCGSCVRACPEDVLGMVDGRAAIINGLRCVGHSLCAEACPVGAVSMGFGKPAHGMEIPWYNEQYESNIPGLYIVGELGGVGLIRNAFSQGVIAVETIASKENQRPDAFDVIIVGAGPGGIAAALSAQAKGLRYVVLEQDDLGGSVLHYLRQKLVLTSTVELPLYGKLKISEISKEDLLDLFTSLVRRFSLNVQTKQKVEAVEKSNEVFSVKTQTQQLIASHVILAVGRRGSPRKLGVPGEHLSKVFYRLIEAETYSEKNILVVGGGDSAIEAAIGLSRQRGNAVTISYRRDQFVRLKEKNERQIIETMRARKVRAIFSSEVLEIRPENVVVRESENIIHNIPNDFVFIFAGGEMPSEFLKKIGVKMRTEERAEAIKVA